MRNLAAGIFAPAILLIGCVSEKEKVQQCGLNWQKKAASVKVGMTLSEAHKILPIWEGPPRKRGDANDYLTSPIVITGTGSGQVEVFQVDKNWDVVIRYSQGNESIECGWVTAPVEVSRSAIQLVESPN